MSDITVSTKDQVGTYDAVETAKPGEPIFALQGGDPLGPLCVMFWAWKARQLARREEDPKKAKALLLKAAAAEEVAWAMRDYRDGEPEAPVEERASYNDAPSTQPRNKWQPGVIAGVRQLRDAAASFSSAAPHLPEDQARALFTMVGAINAAADKYQPRRASYSDTPEFPTE